MAEMALEGVKGKAKTVSKEQVYEGEEEEGAPAWGPGGAALVNLSFRGWPVGAAGRAPWGLKVGAMGALLCSVSGYVWGTEADPETEGEPLMKTGMGTLHPGLPGDLQGENPLPEPCICPMELLGLSLLLLQEGGR